MPFFKHNNTELFYVDQDERTDKSIGIPLVFVHGAGSSHIIWTLQVLKFKKTNRVISLDLSGHGKSEKSLEDPSIENGFAYEVAALVEHLGLEDFVLIGHSMGGGIVMAYALNDEFKQPKAIALVDTSPNLDLRKLALGLVREAIDGLTDDFDLESFGDTIDGMSVKEFEESVKKFDRSTFFDDLDTCDDFNVTDKLHLIKMPAFVIVGDDDDITPLKVAEKLEKALPRADIAIVKDADHRPMVEQHELFNNMLNKFIEWVEE